MHTISQLVGLYAGFQIEIRLLVAAEVLVQRCHQIQFPALLIISNGFWRKYVENGGTLIAEERSLIGCGQEAVAPVIRTAEDLLVIGENYERRQILIRRAQSVLNP